MFKIQSLDLYLNRLKKNKKNEFARKLLKLPTTDAQNKIKSTFEKIEDFSRKIRKDDIVDDDDAVDDDEDSVVVESSSKKNLGNFLLILMGKKKISKKLCQNLFLLLELQEMKK